jgi:hypothetical protein
VLEFGDDFLEVVEGNQVIRYDALGHFGILGPPDMITDDYIGADVNWWRQRLADPRYFQPQTVWVENGIAYTDALAAEVHRITTLSLGDEMNGRRTIHVPFGEGANGLFEKASAAMQRAGWKYDPPHVDDETGTLHSFVRP